METYKRTSPIGVVAKDFLIDIIKQEQILHNKNTNGRIVLLKKQAWARVAEKFNAKITMVSNLGTDLE